MMFGFSRDGGLPSFFHKVDARFSSPIRTVWLAAFLAFLLAVPSLGSAVAFSAATSIATIGLYISYGIPILITVIYPQGYIKGPFSLGRFSRPVGIIACSWIGFITIVFNLPTLYPVNSQTVNYTPVAVGIILLFSLGSWVLWARKWFVGPMKSVQAERMGINPDDVEAVQKAEAAGILDEKL